MLHAGVDEAARNFSALVVGNDALNFSAGANLMLLLLEAQEGNWDEVDLMVRAFQGATQALRYADVPVVVAPAGLTLGGGCEIVLHTARVQAAAETYIGLVEAGVGLIPAGGGTKEMLARAMAAMPAGADPLPLVQRVFETIGFARVSTSAADARRLGYLRDGDAITMNRERLLADAKATALELAREAISRRRRGWRSRSAASRPRGAQARRPPGAGAPDRISDHDAVVGRKLAWILAGGDADRTQATVTEQELLDLEREAFLQPVRRAKDARAHRHTLKTGKPLRNWSKWVRRGQSRLVSRCWSDGIAATGTGSLVRRPRSAPVTVRIPARGSGRPRDRARSRDAGSGCAPVGRAGARAGSSPIPRPAISAPTGRWPRPWDSISSSTSSRT